ncbi:hypothetical protein BOTBODRAFT_39481 [Botryobasidium botryosum FD-172 SS1]|uniref:Uncharacterized protein n=1 Tax=Botryobasidium botryosum (strain FD-172 SS1) TaxID=930990 RepID=A0A067M3W6_BOTB1|nr:hypothetical protein BOTBODRAFT_39481 [Botryobasidium botryosum FD-172 SS1]
MESAVSVTSLLPTICAVGTGTDERTSSLSRLVLNYKRLPYKTVWVSIHEVASTLRGLGLEPLQGSRLGYTLPIIADPTPSGSPVIVRDSWAIAQYLDKTYPDEERLVFPSGSHALQALLLNHLSNHSALRSLVVPLIPAILDEGASEYYYESRSCLFGKPLEQVRPTGEKLEAAWKDVKALLDLLDSFLEKNDVQSGGVGGDFVMGDRFSFADTVLVGFFILMSKVKSDEDGIPWERVRGMNNGRWERMWKKCEEFMEIK